MREILLRGRLLYFVRQPENENDTLAYCYEEDGALLINNGKIKASGDFSNLRTQCSDTTEIIDHRPHLMMPGFIDCHAHFPQMQIIGSYGEQLLDWLNNYTFPEETRFHDADHCQRIAGAFLDEMVRHGTTTAAVYCSVHKVSADAFFQQAKIRNMAMIAGKVMMDRDAPEALRDTPQSSFDDTVALIDKWHGKGRLNYAISPRFAITSTPQQLEMAQALAHEYRDCYIQTHLAENRAEIEYTLKLYPDMQDYTQIYAHYDLLRDNCLLGHCVYLSERERDVLHDTRSVAVFCPTSNMFLGSGLFDYDGLSNRDKSVRIACATDIGGGTNYSMLRTLDEGYKVTALRGKKLSPLQAFWQITLGNAQALNMADKIGTLAQNSDGDVVILNAHATPAMALRMERIETLAQELFLLQTLGDDRAIVETYVAGSAQKSMISSSI